MGRDLYDARHHTPAYGAAMEGGATNVHWRGEVRPQWSSSTFITFIFNPLVLKLQLMAVNLRAAASIGILKPQSG